ncbi:Dentin sialophosphoprotein [Schistosoma japonicum]|uniref:Dentin sialophosphoprotein n=1 Tax=Schistosoma japonicum TaxID=6182 RepID=A0A4Z2D8S3_SCHJA|nr:Dentin sialophosphoprotein [Schistosoma japonicum]TNN12820.1 Dentin sialophosphoprotein [Schistosoma japonicum]
MIPTIKLLSLVCLLSYVKAGVLPVSPTEDEVLFNRVIRSNLEGDNVTDIQGTASTTEDAVDKEGTYNSDINTSKPMVEFNETYNVNYMRLNNNISEVTTDIESEIETITTSHPTFIDLTTVDNNNNNISDVGYSYKHFSESTTEVVYNEVESTPNSNYESSDSTTQSDESTRLAVAYLHTNQSEYSTENINSETESTANPNSEFNDSTTGVRDINSEGIAYLRKVLPESTTEVIYHELKTTANPDYDTLSSTEIAEVTHSGTDINQTDFISSDLRNQNESSATTNTSSPTVVVEDSDNQTETDVYTDTNPSDLTSENVDDFQNETTIDRHSSRLISAVGEICQEYAAYKNATSSESVISNDTETETVVGSQVFESEANSLQNQTSSHPIVHIHSENTTEPTTKIEQLCIIHNLDTSNLSKKKKKCKPKKKNNMSDCDTDSDNEDNRSNYNYSDDNDDDDNDDDDDD